MVATFVRSGYPEAQEVTIDLLSFFMTFWKPHQMREWEKLIFNGSGLQLLKFEIQDFCQSCNHKQIKIDLILFFSISQNLTNTEDDSYWVRDDKIL